MSLSFLTIYDVRAVTAIHTREKLSDSGHGASSFIKVIEVHTTNGQFRIRLVGSRPPDLKIGGIVV